MKQIPYGHQISVVKVILTISVFLFSISWAYAQHVDPEDQEFPSVNFLPPSPTSSELGKYGLVPVSMATGDLNKTIPLYTFQTKNLSIPISISYNSDIKVDQVATIVGLGWSLNAGGVITRIVKDEPDVFNPIPYPSNISDLNDPETLQYLENAANPNFDSEPDLYAFNFLGYQGKFAFSREGEAITIPHEKFKIRRAYNEGNGYGNFIITTPDGIRFTFGGNDAVEFSKTSSSGTGCGKTYDQFVETAWYLKKIEHPQGDVIQFQYKKNGFKYPAEVNQSVIKSIKPNSFCGGVAKSCSLDKDTRCKNWQHVSGVYLEKIYTDHYGSVEFNTNKDRIDLDNYRLNEIIIKDPKEIITRKFSLSYIFSNNEEFVNQHTLEELKHRMFLSGMVEKDKDDHENKTYLFKYNDIDGMPPRLSYAQDHFGYFNGEDNDDLVPKNLEAEHISGRKLFEGVGGNREPNGDFAKKGVLKKIIYPTGGYNEIFYEPNTYWGEKTVYSDQKIEFYISTSGKFPHFPKKEEKSFYNPTNQEVKITLGASIDPEYTEEDIDPTHHFASIRIMDITDDITIINNVEIIPPNTWEKYIDLKEDHQYRVELTAHGDIVDADIGFEYYNSKPREIETNIETGGIRVSKTISYDPVVDNEEITEYHYSKLSSLDHSSGKIGFRKPVYYKQNSITYPCDVDSDFPCENYSCSYGQLYSNSQVSLYSFQGNAMMYEYVTVNKGGDFENGAEEYKFLMNYDIPGGSVAGEPIPNAPYSNTGWNNGLEKYVKFYKRKSDGTFTLLKKVINNYKSDNRNKKEVPGLVVLKRYTPQCYEDAIIECNESNINAEPQTITTCVADHQHIWYTGDPILKNVECIAVGANIKEIPLWTHPCTAQEKSEGDIVTIPSNLDYIDAQEYKNIGHWYYLSSKTTIQYDENGENPRTSATNYFYDNPDHAQVTRIATTKSNGKKTVEHIKYPEDYEDAVENIQTLKENHLISLPVKTERTVEDNQIQGQLIRYNDVGQPLNTYQYEASSLSPPTPHDPAQLLPSQGYQLRDKFIYDETTHNIREVVPRDNPNTAYIWGYSGTKIIAQVIGAKSDQVFHTSFEDNGTTGQAKTGDKYIDAGSYTISTSDFDPSSLSGLKMTYWYWKDGKWNFSGEQDFERTISNGSRLDEVRVYPHGAQMTTITYRIGVGITSMTDANNVTTHYKYDGFGRLKKMKDKDDNILKAYDYQFFNNNN